MLIVDGYEWNSPISAATKQLNQCQLRTNASMCSEIMLKNSDISVE
jgi:hypothetical protein